MAARRSSPTASGAARWTISTFVFLPPRRPPPAWFRARHRLPERPRAGSRRGLTPHLCVSSSRFPFSFSQLPSLPSPLLYRLFFLPPADLLLSIVLLFFSSQLRFVLGAAILVIRIFGQLQRSTLPQHARMGWFLSGAGHTLKREFEIVCFL